MSEMYKDIHDRLTLIAGKILLREESEANRDLYLEIKSIKEELTAHDDNGHLYCPLCESLIDVEEEDEEEEVVEDPICGLIVKEKREPISHAQHIRNSVGEVE